MKWVTLCITAVLLIGCTKEKDKLKLLFAGDLMLDRGTRDKVESNNIGYLFSDVKHLFQSSDVTVANFECVACDKSLIPINKKFTFRANPEWLSSIRNNGISYLTLANNHTFDFGEEGLRQTISNLKQNGINIVGYKKDTEADCLPTLIEKNGNKVAIFSATFLKQDNGIVCNETVKELAINIKKFKYTHPSYLIFICLHWGIEMELKPTIEQIQQAHFLVNEGADVIIGHHPHVVQTIELYNGKYIFYSIGNFIFDNNRIPANQGIFATFSLSENKIEDVQIIPFNIVDSKPKLMTTIESEKFMNGIDSISKGINFKVNGDNWEILY